MRVAELATFIKERERARLGKVRDPIIAKYRFCNVIRADDRVTQFIFEWARWWDDDPDQWFVFVVARLFNQPETLDAIKNLVLPFKGAAMLKLLTKRKEAGHKIFNAAYIVSTNGRAMDKIEYVLTHVLLPIWQNRGILRPRSDETFASWHKRLTEFQGMGSFMAAQVIADLKYFPPYYERQLGLPTKAAADWWMFAASGPGSRRGLNRVVGKPVDAGWKEEAWWATLTDLHRKILPKLPASIGTRLTAQDLQNCLCEFDKYERARLGEGVPKQIYKPYKETE